MTVDIATRAYIVALKASGGKTSLQIAGLTGISIRSIDRIYARAIERGFDPNQQPIHMEDAYLADAPRSGRPSKQTEEVKANIINRISHDRYGRERTGADISASLRDDGIEVSASTVRRILHQAGYRKTKPTRKPGLTQKMKRDRLNWCLSHRHWTLEDWKDVI
jgi:transposase